MKALSVRQPHAEQIARGKKKIEYRGWKTAAPCELLIVSSSRRDVDSLSLREESLGREHLDRVYPVSVAVCVVELVRITGEPDAWEWHLRNPRRVKPFFVKGKIFTFDVPDRLIHFA